MTLPTRLRRWAVLGVLGAADCSLSGIYSDSPGASTSSAAPAPQVAASAHDTVDGLDFRTTGAPVKRGVIDPGPRPGPAGAGAPATTQPIAPDSSAAQAVAAAACMTGLSTGNAKACAQAVIRMQEVDSVHGTVGSESGTGLGPTFNGNSCTMCHAEPGVLGSSPGLASPQHSVPNPQVALATLDGAQNVLPPFITADGPVREVRFPSDNGVHGLFTVAGRVDAPGCAATQPAFDAQPVSFRIPTPTYGLGLVENTPDDAILANLAASAAQFNTGGFCNTTGNDGTVTRFGWKAQNKSLLIFASEAYNVEQGVSNELFPNERSGGAGNLTGCLALNPTPEDTINLRGFGADTVSDVSSDTTNFALAMRFSAPPQAVPGPFTIQSTTISAGEISSGQALFASVGCASCHTPSLTTAASSFDPALSNVTYHPYSDFAVHSMGRFLADGITQGNAGVDQFRTAPLWGVGQRLYFLHDGRTGDLTEAIAAHGGDASTVMQNFANATYDQQQQIVYFLRSL